MKGKQKTMKAVNKLKGFAVVSSLVIALVWLTGCDDDGKGGGSIGTNAPASIVGAHISHSITAGTGPFPASGTLVLTANGSGTYTISGSTNSSGTYIYTPDTNSNTAVLELQNDTAFGNVTEQLLFNNSRSGTFSATSDLGGDMSGQFNIH
jgi:hypothetical protein